MSVETTMCDSCKHDLEALVEQRDTATSLAAEWFGKALAYEARIEPALDAACECRGKT